MRILVTAPQLFTAENGKQVVLRHGQEYGVTEQVGRKFVALGVAVQVDEPKPAPAPKEQPKPKAQPEAPEVPQEA
jgi:hypothetical protein